MIVLSNLTSEAFKYLAFSLLTYFHILEQGRFSNISSLMSKPNKDDSSPLVSLFKSIGLTQAKAADAVKAPKSANILKEIIESHAAVAGGLGEKKASLISTLAIVLAKTSAVGSDEKEYVINGILDSKLKTVDQITGEYFELRIYLSRE